MFEDNIATAASPAVEKPKPQPRVRRSFLRALLIIGAILVALGATGYLGWLYYDAKVEVRRLTADPQAAANIAFTESVNKIGKLMLLPEDETPTLATITDVEKIKEQPFFSKAANGDKVLIYTENKLAILYRPSDNKIIAVGTVNLETTNP